MVKKDTLRHAAEIITKFWIEALEQEYKDKKIGDAFSIIAKESGLKNLDEDSIYSAGLMWHQYFDLRGALKSKSIHAEYIVVYMIEEIANEFKVSKKDVTNIYLNEQIYNEPYLIFFEFYKLFDSNIPNLNDLIKGITIGFANISKIIEDHSVSKELFENWKNK